MTSLYGIIGDPITHSLSPAMHNAAFTKLKFPGVYLPFRVRPQELDTFLERLKKLGIRGFNVTIPHKEKILRYLDKIEPGASEMGAVNTVIRTRGQWVGFNTDGAGYLLSLQHEAKFRVRHKRVLLVGAGGASRGLAHALLKAGVAQLTIANRTLTRAEKLVETLRVFFPNRQIDSLSLTKLSQKNVQPDLMINATSLGLDKNHSSLPVDFLPKGCLVSDLVYRPRITPLLAAAKQRKLAIHEGWGMLLYQGVLAFELWTGLKPPVPTMKKALWTHL